MKLLLLILLPLVFIGGAFFGAWLVNLAHGEALQQERDSVYHHAMAEGRAEALAEHDRVTTAVLNESSRLHSFIDAHGLAERWRESEAQRRTAEASR